MQTTQHTETLYRLGGAKELEHAVSWQSMSNLEVDLEREDADEKGLEMGMCIRW
jgi:hypothetical protein